MNPTANNAQGTNTHSYPAYDYPVGIGTGLVAVKSGTIVDMGTATRKLMGNLTNTQHWPEFISGAQNSGNVINIDHGNGEITSYLHVSPYDVNAFRGRIVKQGEVFHKSGHNGWSTGPHLHFEVWKNGQRIDPGPWLANINQGGNVSTSQQPVDRTIVELEYNNGLLRGANESEWKSWVNQGISVEAFQRTIQTSHEHIVIIEQQQLGVEVKRLLGNDTTAANVEQRMKDKYAGESGEFVKTEVYVKKG